MRITVVLLMAMAPLDLAGGVANPGAGAGRSAPGPLGGVPALSDSGRE